MNSSLHRQTDSKFCQLPKIDRQTDSNLESCIRENVFPFQKSLPSQLACLWCSSVTGDRSYRCELCLRARKVSVFGVHDVWSSRTDAQILLCVARAGYTSGFFFRSNIQSNNWIKQCLLTDHVHSRIYKHICFQVKYSIKLLNQSLLTDHKHSNRMHQVNNLSQLCRKVLARGLSCQVNLCLVFICSWCAFDPVQTYNTKSSDVCGAVFAVAYTESKLCGIGEHNKHKNRQWQKMTIEEW